MNPSPAKFSRITGTGSHLPKHRVSNSDLAARLAASGVETSDEWIVERTGIKARYFIDEGRRPATWQWPRRVTPWKLPGAGPTRST
jgi:3-oxoacyl-[acyl-carrier-protein] synthase III